MAVGKGGRGRPQINVTPLVDVVLVLLIIFMVLSPAAEGRIHNALPNIANLDAATVLTHDQLLVELPADDRALFHGRSWSMMELERELRGVLAERTERQVFFRVDDATTYGAAVAWMAVGRRAGATAVALSLEASEASNVAPPGASGGSR